MASQKTNNLIRSIKDPTKKVLIESAKDQTMFAVNDLLDFIKKQVDEFGPVEGNAATLSRIVNQLHVSLNAIVITDTYVTNLNHFAHIQQCNNEFEIAYSWSLPIGMGTLKNEVEKCVDGFVKVVNNYCDEREVESTQTAQLAPGVRVIESEIVDDTTTKLQPAKEKAYRSFKYAESEMETPPRTDEDAYQWLQQNMDQEDYKLPLLETWKKQLGHGRDYYGERKYQKNSDRRSVRSVVAQKDIDISDIRNMDN